MKMRLLIISFITLTCMVWTSTSYAATVGPELKWESLQNITDPSGTDLGNQNVYGYWLNSGDFTVFVECDPATGKPVGRAFYNNEKTDIVKEEVIVDYEFQETEDWSKVKKAEPLEISIMAPNVISDQSWDWDYYLETGEMRRLAKGPVTWPGDTRAYMIPGSDPDYWLIVAELTNPNPFPVKAEIYVSIDDWREGFSSWDDVKTLSKTVEDIPIGANATQYVLINRGKKDRYLGDDIDWESSTRMDAWSEGYFKSNITENLDPKLPESLQKNKGYISFTSYGWGPPEADDLSDGIPMGFSVECHNQYGGSETYWDFEGSVRWINGTWDVYPYTWECTEPELGIQKVKSQFNKWTPANVPRVSEDEAAKKFGDIYFSKLQSSGNSAHLTTGPFKNGYDLPGPVLLDYDSPNDLNLDADVAWTGGWDEYKDNVGWVDEIPVLKKQPTFIELYRFEAMDTEDIGKLVKEIVPGYTVQADEIKRPYLRIWDSFKDFTIEIENNEWDDYIYYKVTVNHHVKVEAVNPSEDVKAVFSNVRLAQPNDYFAKNELTYTLSDWLDADVKVYSKYDDYDDAELVGFGSITISPSQTKTVYEDDVTSEFTVYEKAMSDEYNRWSDDYWRDYVKWVGKEDIEDAMNEIAPMFYDWSGEADFINGAQFNIKPLENSDIITFCQALAKIDDDDDVDYRDFGLVEAYNDSWLKPMSYFDDDGLSMKANDDLWALLNLKKQLNARIRYREPGGYFWPVMSYSSEYKSWHTSLYYKQFFK
ncbi:MAG: hypothetical protein FH756_10835 [Firmicutes bacterium]|nr:hypothetical protein [Bacillota bacterium]